MSDRSPARREEFFLIGLFWAALVAHFYFATTNWTSAFMPGHEFRQSQTAIVSYYIDEQDNFSPLYETPILGKPWVSILLEVPIYEWSVVGLSRAFRMPHFIAARTITLTCFYLALPAIYLLFGRLGLAKPRRLLGLALILACPVYIFYSRAFLIDSMELMCCAWFVLGFVRTMDERRWPWLAVTTVAGIGAALIKGFTLAIWLLPAASYGAWLLWLDVRARQGWRAPLQTVLWGAATILPALVALRWWINLTDPIKAAHASAFIFTSKNLSVGNWGLLDFATRFSPKTWGILLDRWREAIMPPWIIGVGLVAGLACFRSLRRPILGLAAVFFLAQFLFPFAYAYQDYYYYTCTVFLLGAFAVILGGVLDSRLPWWACGLIIAVPFAAQINSYWHGYRPGQIQKSNGGFPFTDALRDLAPKDSVFVIAGADWAAMIPLYSQHKALMVRNGLEFDENYLKRAFDELADEDVSALVLVGKLKENRPFLNLAANRFDMETTPTFSHPIADVYFRRLYIERVQRDLKASRKYGGVTFVPRSVSDQPLNGPFEISAGLARSSFHNISPAPFRGHFAFGLGHMEIDGVEVLSAHPDADLSFNPPARATQITWDFGIVPEAYMRDGNKTDGVEFLVLGETQLGYRQVYRRLLDPANQPADRGMQHAVIPYEPYPGETLRFSTRPNHNASFDWAFWGRIEIK